MRENIQPQPNDHYDLRRAPERLNRQPLPQNIPLAQNVVDDLNRILLQKCIAVIQNICMEFGRNKLPIGGPGLSMYFDRHSLEEYGDFCVKIENLMKEMLSTERFVDIYSDGVVILDAAASKKIVNMIRECCREECNAELDAISRHLAGLEFKLKEGIKPFIPIEMIKIIQSYTHINHPADRPRENGTFTIYMEDPSLDVGYGYASEVEKVRQKLMQALRSKSHENK